MIAQKSTGSSFWRAFDERESNQIGAAGRHGEDFGARRAERTTQGNGGASGRMSSEELREHYDLYAPGLADESGRDEIHVHLERHCAVCETGVQQAASLVAALSATVPGAAPPARLRHRLLASAGCGDALRMAGCVGRAGSALFLRRRVFQRARAAMRRRKSAAAQPIGRSGHRAPPLAGRLGHAERAQHH